jgi:hypothetical protein
MHPSLCVTSNLCKVVLDVHVCDLSPLVNVSHHSYTLHRCVVFLAKYYNSMYTAVREKQKA